MENIDFSTEFLHNFDEILLQTDNPLINSHEHYTAYKQEYLQQTNYNFGEYNYLVSQYKSFAKICNPVSPTKVVYTYIDETRRDQIMKQITKLIVYQRKIYNDFIHYLQHLNQNYNKILQTQQTQSSPRISIESRRSSRSIKSYQESTETKGKKRNIFSKLLDSTSSKSKNSSKIK